jgi:hypothetical protein
MRSVSLFALTSLLAAAPLAAQPVASARRQATASRLPSDSSVRLDGRLDELVWQTAVPISGFVQKEPNEGAPPSSTMEVYFLFDNNALFVGARMSSQTASGIQAPLSRRDQADQAEYILLSLDTYLDRRTAYCFGVTASGVRIDHYHPSDSETEFDSGFDPVWEAQTHVEEAGWSAEMWIPFSQLRFNKSPQQIFGLNIQRRTPTLNEDDYWIAVPRTEQAWASRFGDLAGIDVTSPKRIELLPYVSARSTLTGRPDRDNPFDNGVNLKRSIGLDMKMGVGSNLTLDATVNPDFGQVEADPAEVNLSNFETFFTERRPFFIEGSRLLAGGVNNYFYSRRIGAVPVAPPTADYIDSPQTATILGAAKLTGRLPSGLSVGALAAVTDPERARTFSRTTGIFGTASVAPRSEWGVTRLQQEFGASGSTAGFMFAGVHRNLSGTDPLAALLTRNAFSVSADSVLRLKGGEYQIALDAGITHVDGDPAALLRVQRASPRYLQRPDATYLRFDPSRTSLNGGRTNANIERRNGRHWLWSVAMKVESPELEHNDTGRLGNGDGISPADPSVTFRETRPGRLLRSYQLTLGTNNEWTFGGTHTTSRVSSTFQATLANFWSVTSSATLNRRGLDWQLTRGGPLMQTPHGWTWTTTLRNRSSAQTAWSGTFEEASDELGGTTHHLEGQISVRPQPNWQLSLAPVYERAINPRQYVTTLDGGRQETYGSRYVFAFTDRTTLSAQLRLTYTFKPDLTLEAYAEPFAASGRFYDFGELLAPRSRFLLEYGTTGTTVQEAEDGSRVIQDGASSFTIGNRDFNVRSFRSNVVLRWEWRPASTLFVVWQQNRTNSIATGGHVGPSDLFGSLSARGENVLAIKTTFWLSR